MDVAAALRAARVPRVALTERLRAAVEPGGVFLFGFLVVTLVAGNTGGYLPTTQGWTAVLTLGLAAIGLLLRRDVRLGPAELVLVGGVAAFTGWVAASAMWSPSVTATMYEVQRNLAYLGVAAAGVVLVRGRTVRFLLGGILAGVTLLSLYALGTRLLPDRIGSFDSEAFGYRLATPITYWNGLGIFAVTGALLAASLAARGRSYLVRGLASAAIPVLLLTNYFTFSRGAWLALAVGLAVVVLADPRRLQYLAVIVPLATFPAAAVVLASREDGLTTPGSTFGQAIDEGHALVLPTVLLCAGAAAVGAIALLVERHARVPGVVRLVFVTVIAAGIVAGAAAAWSAYGAPHEIAQRAWNGFTKPYQGTGPNLSDRLFQLSSGGRVELWEVSWQGFERRPAVGTGAGSFAQEWVRHRDVASTSTEGHSLYAEVLGELGVVGVVLLLVALLAPVAGGLGARGEPLVVPALGAYAAFVAHAGVDWDWELTGVGATGFLIGVALVRARRAQWRAPSVARWAAVGAVVAVAVVAFWGLAGAEAVRSATDAMRDGDAKAALHDLDRAAGWAPWSSTPAELRANVYLSDGRRALAADAYRDAIAKDRTNWLLWSALSGVTTGAERRAALAQVERLNPMQG